MPDAFAPIPHWTAAVAFANRHHGGDLRRRTRVPYLTHVMAVAETLAHRYPDRDELIVAGLLHDVVEDTVATFDDVAAVFGDRVAALVRAVSKDDDAMDGGGGVTPEPTDPTAKAALWRRRRAFMLGHLQGEGVDPDVLRLKAADALANLRAIHRDLRDPAVGRAVWSRFKVGADDSLWFYQAILDAVAAGLGDEPIVADLRAALAEVRSEA